MKVVQPERSLPLNSEIAFARSVPSSAHVGPAGVAASPILNRASHPMVHVSAFVPVQVFDPNHGEEADTPSPREKPNPAQSGHLKHRYIEGSSISRRGERADRRPGTSTEPPGPPFIPNPTRTPSGVPMDLFLAYHSLMHSREPWDEDVRNRGARLRPAWNDRPDGDHRPDESRTTVMGMETMGIEPTTSGLQRELLRDFLKTVVLQACSPWTIPVGACAIVGVIP